MAVSMKFGGTLMGLAGGLMLAAIGTAGVQTWRLGNYQDALAEARADLNGARATNERNGETIRELRQKADENAEKLRAVRAQAADAESRRVAARRDARSRIAETEAELQEALSRDPTSCDTVYPGDDVDRMLSRAADRIRASADRGGTDRPGS